MASKKKMPKEYAIIVSLSIFFALVTLVGIIRLVVIADESYAKVDLDNIQIDNNEIDLDIARYNLSIANAIKEEYDIDIYYGDKLNLESVNGIAITDEQKIFDMLCDISSALSVYPQNLVREIENKGYSVSIYLVDYFTTNVEALANRNTIGQFKIYISNTPDLKRALHHEYYHILDYYIKLEANESLVYKDWNKYNPIGFKYVNDVDNITSKYVYNNDTGSYFVTAYAKYSEKEDRAETFAEMITANRQKLFFNDGEPIKGKINIINSVLNSTFKTIGLEENLIWK